MNFNIEKGVKLTTSRNVKAEKYNNLPLEQMVEGDSIFVPFTFASKYAVGNYISVYKKRTNTNFTLRSEKEGVRIFKLA